MKSLILSLTILSLLGLSFLSCKSNKIEKKAPVLTSKGAPYAKMQLGGCYGRCPVYNLTIFEGGFVEIKNTQNLEFEGAHRKRVSQEYMDKLDMAFAKADFANLQEAYESQLVDLPLTRITKYTNGVEKMVAGKETLPESVKALKKLIHEIVSEPTGWIAMEEMELKKEDAENEGEKTKSKIIYNEYIIQPEPGVRLSDWLKESESLGLKLKKRLSGSNNLWLLICEQDRYAPKELLKMLQDDPSIRKAEFNTELELR